MGTNLSIFAFLCIKIFAIVWNRVVKRTSAQHYTHLLSLVYISLVPDPTSLVANLNDEVVKIEREGSGQMAYPSA